MILIGLTGGMGQGKSTVGEMLRKLAGVDYRADLESSYPISEVANAWLEHWPGIINQNNQTSIIDLANELIKMVPSLLEQFTGKQTDAETLSINNNLDSLATHNRLLNYLQNWQAMSDAERAVQLPVPMDATTKGLHRKLLQWLGGVSVNLVDKNIWSDVLEARIKELTKRDYLLVTVGGIRYKADTEMVHRNDGLVLRVVRPGALADSDTTEQLADISADIELANNGSLSQLEVVVKSLWQDLQSSSPAKHYKAL